MAKTWHVCALVWALLLASALIITGLTIGIIGAVGYSPLAGFINNSQKSTCTLQDWRFNVTRCVKWGNCLGVAWNCTYPSLQNSAETATAMVFDKTGMGYYDAIKVANQRKAGDVVSCLIDKRGGKTGYFKRPGNSFLAQLIIGWLFFFFGLFTWIFFFMWTCCDINVCACLNGGSSSSSKTVTSTPNPLYNSTKANSQTDGSVDDEMNPIPPVGQQEPEYDSEHSRSSSDEGAGAGAGAHATSGGYAY